MGGNNLNIEEQYGLWDEYCKCKNNPRLFLSNPKGPLELNKTKQYKLSDEYSKLNHEDEHEDVFECESSDFNNYADSRENFHENFEEFSVEDLSPEGMGYEYFSDDEYLGDQGDCHFGSTSTENHLWE